MNLFKTFSLLGILVFTTNLSAQVDSLSSVKTDSLYLNIVIPEEDTTVVNLSRYRLAANTLPNARAYINGVEVRVYETGAFVEMIELDKDTVEVEFKVELNGESISTTMVFLKPVIEEAIDYTSDVFSPLNQLPNDQVWVKSGEELLVQFAGKPNQKAVFNIDGFRRNIPIQETKEGSGIYRAKYMVGDRDEILNTNITYKVKRGLFGYHKLTNSTEISLGGLPRVGEVTAERAYFNIGLGSDRLGGAKFGSIEKGVLLNIVERKNNNYRVQLSSSMSAWIPVGFVELKDEWEPRSESLTGNIRVSGNSTEDLVILNLSKKLPYISNQKVNPNQIIVDVFGASSNTNWNTMLSNAEGIDKVEWEQMEGDRYRLTIDIAHNQNWGYSVGYGWGSQLLIKVRKPPVVEEMENPLKNILIAVDAGHGGENNGALGASGAFEKDVALSISHKLDSVLVSRGAKTIMTRTDDSYVYMSERADVVRNSKAAILVSVHLNSVGYPTDPRQISGTGIFYKHNAHRPLGLAIYKKMLELGFDDYGITSSFNFSLSAPIEFPNVLVETAFISNPEEEAMMLRESFQIQIAEKIADGLEEYFLENADISKAE